MLSRLISDMSTQPPNLKRRIVMGVYLRSSNWDEGPDTYKLLAVEEVEKPWCLAHHLRPMDVKPNPILTYRTMFSAQTACAHIFNRDNSVRICTLYKFIHNNQLHTPSIKVQ